MTLRGLRRVFGGALAVAVLGAVLAGSASADLKIVLRLPGGTTDGGAVELTGPTQVVQMEVWAVVTGANGNPGDEGLFKAYASFLSNNATDRTDPTTGTPGVALGNLTHDHIVYPVPWPPFTYAPWGGTGSGLGAAADIDGDGDLDIGSPDMGTPPFFGEMDPAPPWFCIRSVSGDVVLGAAQQIGVLTFTGTGWGLEYNPGSPSGVTHIYARPRKSDNGWMEDGVEVVSSMNGNGGNGSSVDFYGEGILLYLASAADAGGLGGQLVEPGGAPLVLNGMASTGSINWWAWDLNDDGVYDIQGHDKGNLSLTYEELLALGLTDGDYTAEMLVGWSESPLVNTSTDTFGFTMMVPEPATLALVGLGLATLLRRRR